MRTTRTTRVTGLAVGPQGRGGRRGGGRGAYRRIVADDDGADWREQRRRAVRAHAAADERRRAAEQAEAAELVAWFVAEATRRGLRPTRLVAGSYSGGGRYRTGLTGWYVDRARTRAVDVEGRFYLLTVPGGLRSRLFGATPAPRPAPLVVGEGGRDGDSVPLRTLLGRRLDEGETAGPGDAEG